MWGHLASLMIYHLLVGWANVNLITLNMVMMVIFLTPKVIKTSYFSGQRLVL